jgi:glycine/D-amino acid oxidase-like deaminating enzyme
MNASQESTVDAIVVGAGIVGASIALELSRGGRSVLVLDKGDAVGGGTTSASSSIIRFHYSTLAGCIASWEAMYQWADWANHLGHAEGSLARFFQTGMLAIAPAGEDFSVYLQHFRNAGIPGQVLSAAEIAEKFPALEVGSFTPAKLPSDANFFADPSGEICALYQPDAGFVDDPQLATQNLMDAARANGAQVRLRTAVADVVVEDGRARGVKLENGEVIRASIVVNAAGPWSSALNARVGADADMRIRTRPMRQTIASCRAPENFSVGGGGCVIADMDLGAYGRPQPGGSYIIGGVESPCDPVEWVVNPDDADLNPDPDMFEALVYRTARRIPSVEVPLRPQGLASVYDVADDWTPIFDKSCINGYYMAVGTSGNQFKNGPIIGQIMATLIDAVESGHDHDNEPVHMHCSYTGLDLDISQFSRLREPANTGGNVWG